MNVLLYEIVPVAAEERIKKLDVVLDDPVVIYSRQEKSIAMLFIVKDSQTFDHKPICLVFDIPDIFLKIGW